MAPLTLSIGDRLNLRLCRVYCPTCNRSTVALVRREETDPADLRCGAGHPVILSPGVDDHD